MDLKLNFLIIGGQKTASTFIHECIKEHDDIFMPDGETPYFEDPDYQNNNLADYFKTTYPLEFRKLGIKRPNYLFNLSAMRRIKNDFPDAKLIVVLRDPVIRFQSAVNHYMKYNFIPVEDINSSIKKIFNDKTYCKNFPRANELLEFGLYAKYLSEYFKLFSKDKFHLIFSNDIKNNPKKIFKELFNFLEVNDIFIPKAINTRPQKVDYRLKFLKIIAFKSSVQFKYSKDKMRLYERKNPTLIRKIFIKLIDLLLKLMEKIYWFKNSKKNIISKENTNLLRNFYKDDIKKLENLLDTNLKSWYSSN